MSTREAESGGGSEREKEKESEKFGGGEKNVCVCGRERGREGVRCREDGERGRDGKNQEARQSEVGRVGFGGIKREKGREGVKPSAVQRSSE